MNNRVEHCGIVVLAGGQSQRLGSPKQLLPYLGTTLLRHAAETALAAGMGPVVVVVGANSTEVLNVLQGLDVVISENPGWQEGMASSLRAGLRQLLSQFPATDAVIFMVCDQPFVTKTVLLCLKETAESAGKGITAAGYGGKAGTPALFRSSFFERLMSLEGDKGARLLIASCPDEVTIVPFEEGAVDIDTKDDYRRLLNINI